MYGAGKVNGMSCANGSGDLQGIFSDTIGGVL